MKTKFNKTQFALEMDRPNPERKARVLISIYRRYGVMPSLELVA
jgi:hypothetical protein